MSRSYKHTPWCGDNKTVGKRLAKRAWRRRVKNLNNPTLNYSLYKRTYDQYDVCDYGFLKTFDEYWDNVVEDWHWFQARGWHEKQPDREAAYRKWYKTYKRK